MYGVVMRGLLISLFLLALVIGCGDISNEEAIKTFDSSEMDALSIDEPTYREAFKSELQAAGIPFAELRILDGELYVVTWKSDKDAVEDVYRKAVGVRPGKHAQYILSAPLLERIMARLDQKEVEYRVGEYYGASYIEWSESDDRVVRDILSQAAEMER
jgi:hypothetical protein